MDVDDDVGTERGNQTSPPDDNTHKLARYSLLGSPPQQQDLQLKLDWRDDPSSNFSDWTIEIKSSVGALSDDGDDDDADTTTVDSTHIVQTYHVHKAVLACGARKSDYFARVFKSQFNEGAQHKSRIELEPLAASAFPDILDFLYSLRASLKIDTSTASALYALGDYFEIRLLVWEVVKFVKKDVSPDNLHTYYDHAKTFHNDVLLGCVAEYMAKNIHAINVSNPIMTKPDPQLWSNVLEYSGCDGASTSAHLSELICEFCERHSDVMDDVVFDALTDHNKIPRISPKIALKFCKLDDKFRAGKPKKEGLSLVKLRCATAISETWREYGNSDDTLKDLATQEPAFLVMLLSKSLDQSITALTACQTALGETQKELESVRKENCETVVKMLRKFYPMPENAILRT